MSRSENTMEKSYVDEADVSVKNILYYDEPLTFLGISQK